MADLEVGTQRMEMAEYVGGSWGGTTVDYPTGGLSRVGGSVSVQDVSTVEKYATGATRSTDNPFDPEGFISPAVLAGYCDYMTKHRVQRDGNLRDGDNWQKGLPTYRAYRSLTRHFLDLWLLKRGYPARSVDCTSQEDALHAILFNVMVILKNRIDGDHHE